MLDFGHRFNLKIYVLSEVILLKRRDLQDQLVLFHCCKNPLVLAPIPETAVKVSL